MLMTLKQIIVIDCPILKLSIKYLQLFCSNLLSSVSSHRLYYELVLIYVFNLTLEADIIKKCTNFMGRIYYEYYG